MGHFDFFRCKLVSGSCCLPSDEIATPSAKQHKVTTSPRGLRFVSVAANNPTTVNLEKVLPINEPDLTIEQVEKHSPALSSGSLSNSSFVQSEGLNDLLFFLIVTYVNCSNYGFKSMKTAFRSSYERSFALHLLLTYLTCIVFRTHNENCYSFVVENSFLISLLFG